MLAIEKVREKLKTSNLKGKVEKTHHKLLKGYWWFPPKGGSVYLGASEQSAFVAIDTLKYSVAGN